MHFSLRPANSRHISIHSIIPMRLHNIHCISKFRFLSLLTNTGEVNAVVLCEKIDLVHTLANLVDAAIKVFNVKYH